MKATLKSVYIDEKTMVGNDKLNVTKRLVYQLDESKFVVVKTFSLKKQDVDFSDHYRSVKIWINADEESVSSHWNTKKVDNVSDYLTHEMVKLSTDTMLDLVDCDEVDTSMSGYMYNITKKRDVIPKNDNFLSQDWLNVNLEYYIIDERFVVVFQIKSANTYCYWDLKGKEDHRFIVSAKGPFDNTIEVKEGKPWIDYKVEYELFISKVGIEESEIENLWNGYIDMWLFNIKAVSKNNLKED